MEFWSDAKSIAQRDPAAKSPWEVFWLYSGYHAVLWHRLAHWFYNRRLFFIARAVSQLSRFLTNIEIHPGAKIGKGLFIDHGTGVVIGETAEIGDNCTIYHGVTLGGTGKDTGKRHPTIGNNVLIGTGAKVLGPFRVGDNSRIGANSVVLEEVPPNTTVTGVPGRQVKQKQAQNPSLDLDQIHLPDPVYQELCELMAKVDGMTKQLAVYQARKENPAVREQMKRLPAQAEENDPAADDKDPDEK